MARSLNLVAGCTGGAEMDAGRLRLDAATDDGARVPSNNVVALDGVVLGYNHDVPYAGRVFHIQTEASGRSTGRIFTHVFESGLIVASNRASYERGTQARRIAELARDSHKLMMRRLVRGELDAEISRGPSSRPALVQVAAEASPPAADDATPLRDHTRIRELIEGFDMDNITQVLESLRNNVAGTLGVALVDYESGMCLGTLGNGLNMDVAAAGNAEVMKAKARVMRDLGIQGGIEDILITLESQYHIIRPVGTRLFFYLAIDRKQGNLALARHKLGAAAAEVKL
jgi:predicted regulator of Ras-like GTPase activity (Roadblock/LC7/MglB family)